ncbi:hypothetical protein HU200_054634 [Digitaria exilis]|uniref:UDP-glycosyltransferases domain-containing protein n=1 Tax=Digitaria exilis TaxID=1010633 RepID=A0A835E3Y0_9POAL|nr:hypothetical protein HU200_054634 [Digitaria exilis]
MMQLADVLVAEGYAVAVALIDLTMDHDATFAAAVRAAAAAKPPLVTFHTLPRITNPPAVSSGVDMLLGYLEIIRRYNEHLREFLSSMPPRSVHAVVVDALGVAKELGVPGYTFYATNASALAIVVFLCFGSIGAATHSPEQFREIAAGLERSGHRFLWVVRAPHHAEPDVVIDELLPDGFLERTKGRGIVVKLWAPQVEVLHHKATGGFVTHCGWNSVLEGVTAGVPMLCWPMYAEQKMNKVFMVEEAGIGVEVVGWQQGLVTAEEVEAKVRLVLESEDGEQLRARVAAHKDAAAMAWEDGGSSRAAFAQFLSDVDGLVGDA